jgi:hypothetical protein
MNVFQHDAVLIIKIVGYHACIVLPHVQYNVSQIKMLSLRLYAMQDVWDGALL